MYFDFIILYSIQQINNSRTTSSVYHLLKGRKSIQTLQDAKIFQLEHYYSIYPTLTKQQFKMKIIELLQNNWIEITTNKENITQVTSKGAQWIGKHQDDFCFQALNGLKYEKIGDVFFKRLLLLTQTIINSNKSNYRFIPVTDDKQITIWVKKYYQEIKNQKKEVQQSLFQELAHLLAKMPDFYANMFVDRLTGYRKYGLSTQQLARKYQLTVSDVMILFKAMTHFLIAELEKDIEHYNIISSFLKADNNAQLVSKSAYRTNQLLKKGFTIEQIARVRNLRINTIEDHIVEIALYDSYFPFHEYVPLEEQQKIIHVVQSTNTYKLKEIKQKLNEHISYFKIRLVITKLMK